MRHLLTRATIILAILSLSMSDNIETKVTESVEDQIERVKEGSLDTTTNSTQQDSD